MPDDPTDDGGDMPMTQRGVTRDGMGQGGERREMVESHHRRTLWVWWTVVLLGAWMIAVPLTFDYGLNPSRPSGGRGVWLEPVAARAAAMFWSDLASGVALVVLGWLTLKPGRPVAKWLACFVGIWLQFAPLVFWCPSPLAYFNDTLVGVLVIALTILIPGMPGMIMHMKMGGDTPAPAGATRRARGRSAA